MPSDFDGDTAITAVDDGYETVLGDRWSIGTTPNGGYSTAPIIRALCDETGKPMPVSVTTHFARPALESTAGRIRTRVHSVGRRFAYAAGTLDQDGVTRSRTAAVLGELSVEAGPTRLSPRPIDIPDPDRCPGRQEETQGIHLPLLEVVDVRLHPDGPQLDDDGAATLAGWVRFRDDRPPDPLALTFFADALPPAVLGVIERVGWVPSLELTVHVRRAPVPGWIRVAASTSDIVDGLLIEDVRMWDESGALVAQARQLAMPLLKS